MVDRAAPSSPNNGGSDNGSGGALSREVAAIKAATAVQHQHPVNEGSGSGNVPTVAVSTTEDAQRVKGGSASSVACCLL